MTRRAPPSLALRALLALFLAPLLAPARPALAKTFPSEVAKLLALRTELERRGLRYLLETWRCPPASSGAPCDPCGASSGASDSWGDWHYVACRAVPLRERVAAASLPTNAGVVDAYANDVGAWGLVTNVHLSDLAIEGTLAAFEETLCPFEHLRELDMDGGRLRGEVPAFIGRCFPRLTELDLSHNELRRVRALYSRVSRRSPRDRVVLTGPRTTAFAM